MKPRLKSDVLFYLRKNRKAYFLDDRGSFKRRKSGIEYRTFCRALNFLPVEVNTAYTVLEILGIPEKDRPQFIEWK